MDIQRHMYKRREGLGWMIAAETESFNDMTLLVKVVSIAGEIMKTGTLHGDFSALK